MAPYRETTYWVLIKQYFKHPMNDNKTNHTTQRVI